MNKTTLLAFAMTMTASINTALAAEPLRVSILGGENQEARLKSYACFQDYFAEKLDREVKLFPAADYSGFMQGMLGGTLDFALVTSPSAVAGIYLQDPEAVEIIGILVNKDGSKGYHSVVFTRADSGITKLEDLKGKTFAFGDPNSTSGYLIPNYELKQQGYNPEEYFGSVSFSGGHEQSVVGVLNKQFDAAVTWTSAVGDKKAGFTSGQFYKMVQNNMINMDDIEIIWKSNVIPNEPVLVRKSMDAADKAKIKEVTYQFVKEKPECFEDATGGRVNVEPASIDDYKTIIGIRKESEES